MPESSDPIPGRIFTIRGHRVILDADLARLYGVPTHVFNQAVKRSRRRYPEDFAFQLSADEVADLRSQVVTPRSAETNSSQTVMSSTQTTGKNRDKDNRSQSATSSKSKHRGATYGQWPDTALFFLDAHDLDEATAIDTSNPPKRCNVAMEVRPYAAPAPRPWVFQLADD